jgi:2-methylisocitrate lyase-like PEP mutase family enzyme
MAPSVVSQAEKGRAFRALHARDRAFIIPNPWDPGTARLLATLGFEALATTSAGYAFSRGVPDGEIARDEMLEHIADIVAATDLPAAFAAEAVSYQDISKMFETKADTWRT